MDSIISLLYDLSRATRRLLPYIVYNFIFLLSHLLVISVFAFFHFILGHQFNLIEIWVQENIWIVITISKLLCFSVVYQYYRVQNLVTSPIQYYFQRPFRWPDRSFYVLLTFLLFFAILELKPVFNQQWSPLAMGIHFVGQMVYFTSDFLVVSYLIQRDWPESRGDIAITLALAALIFAALCLAIIPSRENFSWNFIFGFFLMLFFHYQQRSWPAGAWVLLGLNGILGTLFGQDMFFEQQIAPFRCLESLGPLQMAIAFGLCLCYLHWQRSPLWRRPLDR